MSNLRIFLFAFFATVSSFLYSQTFDLWQPASFTWEGANTGNKAVWKADDTANSYPLHGNVIKVTMKDPLGLNTTTTNLSEFNDFTRTNTFYGKGNLAFQVTSQQSRQAVCLEFEFSHPSILKKFNVFDIDMLQSGSHLPSTYQDSVHFSAYDMNGEVPLTLSYMSASPVYTIYGQAAKANYIAGVNGDVGHTNPAGGVLVTSESPISKFVLCYANGSEDDGVSNSHAIKILGFEYQEVLGRVEGTVYDYNTGETLAGSTIRLVQYESNAQVSNKIGEIMEVTTTNDGHYVFPSLPLGKYKIVQTNPPGYESHSDVDGPNDNLIVTEININQPISFANDFYEVLNAPLPVKITNVELYQLQTNKYRLAWRAVQEINCDYYDIALSIDGVNYRNIGQLLANNKTDSDYQFDFEYNERTDIVYIRLSQTDSDGAFTTLSIKPLRPYKESTDPQFFPNPFSGDAAITIQPDGEAYSSYRIFDTVGKMVMNTEIPTGITHQELNLDHLNDGLYFIEFYGPRTTKSLKIVKK